MYIERKIKQQIELLAKGFPVVVVTGPRQSGKTTFLQHNYPKYRYFNLEDPVTLQIIKDDFRQFFADNSDRVIVDEIQRLPELLSYLQVHVDKYQKMGSFFLSGSQNLLISDRISQSLAGRAGYQVMYPLETSELKDAKLLNDNIFNQIVKGGYPSIFTREITPDLYFRQYIATYTERDVRDIRNISELSQFRKFMSLLAGRVGQVLNVSSLANDTGISPNTAEDWISILEASYIVFRLRPYYKNINKRVIKSPKLYFYDTGLLSSLLRITTDESLQTHYLLGNIFENYVISELLKIFSNRGITDNIYYFRDNHGNEVDLLIEYRNHFVPVEIKVSSSYSSEFSKGINFWNSLVSQEMGFVVYRGTKQTLKGINYINVNELTEFIKNFK